MFDLHQDVVTNEHQYVTKMALSAHMGGLWGDFTAIFWIIEHLQRSIYIWNKFSKCIMFRCRMDFQSIPLHITYNSQHFQPIQYVNGLSSFWPIFQVNDSKVTIDLGDFPSLLESTMQQPCIQLSQQTTSFHWNEKFDYVLIDFLKNNWESPLEYVVSLFKTSCNTNITKKTRNCTQYLQFLKKKQHKCSC